MLNWALFAVFLLVETVLCNHGDWTCALYSTTVGILSGLSINIFCRSLISIIIGESLLSFDNTISSVGNLKSIPILLGFFISGCVLRMMSLQAPTKMQRLILKHHQHIRFLLELMAGLLLNLFLNLLLYQEDSNSILLKLWGVESCIFSMVGFYIGIWYTWRICRLTDYQVENQKIEQTLTERQAEEVQLRNILSHDTLTGLPNRQKMLDEANSLTRRHIPFTLCFLDLDGLKVVNDQHGHACGDHYLLTVTTELQQLCRQNTDQVFRYGGDEFIVLFRDLPPATADARMSELNQRLEKLQTEEELPYSMSVSYGIVESTAFSEMESLLSEADARMYVQKQEKRRCRTDGYGQSQTSPPVTTATNFNHE